MCLAIGSATPPSNHPLMRLLRGISGNPFAMLGIGAALAAPALAWLPIRHPAALALLLSGLITQPLLGWLFSRLPYWYRQSPVEYLGYMLLFWAWLAALGCGLAGWWSAALILQAAGWLQAWRVLDDIARWIPDTRVLPARLLKLLAAGAALSTLGLLFDGRFLWPLAGGVGLLIGISAYLFWRFASMGCPARA